jgi:hypothetical protein
MTSPITKKEAIKLVKGPFGDAVLKSVAKYAAPVFWESRRKKEGSPIANGTLFLANFRAGCFAVTANHVYQGYLEDKAESPEMTCWIAPEAFETRGKDAIPFDLEERLIDRLEDPDIATFKVTDGEADAIGTSITSLWPPILPEIGQPVVFAGYPGNERLKVGPRELSFAPLPALMIATSVSDRQISCQFEREYLVQAPGFQEPRPHYETGGMSGGPLFTVVERGGISRWHLGAVIKEGNASLDIVTAAPADCILKDGRLRR